MTKKPNKASTPEPLADAQLDAVRGGVNKGELIEWLYELEAKRVTASGPAAGNRTVLGADSGPAGGVLSGGLTSKGLKTIG